MAGVDVERQASAPGAGQTARFPGAERAAGRTYVESARVRKRHQIDRPGRRRQAEAERHRSAIDLDALECRGRNVAQAHHRTGGRLERLAVDQHADLARRRAAQGHGTEGAESSVLDHAQTGGARECQTAATKPRCPASERRGPRRIRWVGEARRQSAGGRARLEPRGAGAPCRRVRWPGSRRRLR